MVQVLSLQDTIVEKYERLRVSLNERTRREFAAAEALAIGRGGVSIVSRAIGIARSTIYRGVRELEERERGATPPAIGKTMAVPVSSARPIHPRRQPVGCSVFLPGRAGSLAPGVS